MPLEEGAVWNLQRHRTARQGDERGVKVPPEGIGLACPIKVAERTGEPVEVVLGLVMVLKGYQQ